MQEQYIDKRIKNGVKRKKKEIPGNEDRYTVERKRKKYRGEK